MRLRQAGGRGGREACSKMWAFQREQSVPTNTQGITPTYKGSPSKAEAVQAASVQAAAHEKMSLSATRGPR
jgi:hypothetical protein